MQTRLKIGMSFAGVAVFAAAIAAAPMLQHNPLLKWAIYLIGGALLSPLGSSRLSRRWNVGSKARARTGSVLRQSCGPAAG